MKKWIGFALVVMSVFVSQVVSSETGVLSLTSPNENIRVDVTVDKSGQLTYQVFFNQIPVITPSALGITVDGIVYGKTSSILKMKSIKGSDSFPCFGKKSNVVIDWKQMRVDLEDKEGKSFSVIFRAFNEGIAFCYEVGGTGERIVSGEETAFAMMPDSTIWYQQNFKWFESVYREKKIEQLEDWDTAALPVTLRLPKNTGYATITEANLADYSGMQLAGNKTNVLKAVFKTDTTWKMKDTLTTPWRVVVLSKDLNTLYNSDIVASLCPEPDKSIFPEGLKTGWIKPGRCVWSWLGDSNRGESRLDFETMKDYVEMASILGFEYNLVDSGWEGWKQDGKEAKWEKVKELVAFADPKNVKIWLWKDSRDGMFDAQKRQVFFKQCSDAGVVGVKLDFMENDNQFTVKWYLDALRDAAACKLLIDFHGASKPTGLSRTWPNELTREGIYGLEQGLQEQGEHNTILPFVRYMAGNADYTPMHFGCKKGETTWPHQIATAILFTSPFLCLADHPVHYVTNPAAEFIQSIPAVWDETVVLPFTEIGQVTGVACRSGRNWYVAVINGAAEKTIELNLSCLPKGKTLNADLLYDDPSADRALVKKQSRYSSKDKIVLTLKKGGGFAGRFSADGYLKPLELTAEQRKTVDRVLKGDFETIFKAVRKSVEEKNAAAVKEQTTDKIEAYIKSCAPKLKEAGFVADPAGKVKVPVELVKEICAIKDNELLIGGTIDLPQHDSPMVVFTNFAWYVVTAKVYRAYMNQPEEFDYHRGVWHNYRVMNYRELSKANTWDLPQQRGYQFGDFVFYAGYHSGITECLERMTAYVNSELVIFRSEYKKMIYKPGPVPFIKGHTFLVYSDKESDLPAVARSMDFMVATGADSICLVTTGQMKTFDSPRIVQTSKDEITRAVIKMAKDRHLKIILKPMVDADDGVWRAWINFYNNNGDQDLARWQQWWDSFNQFILHNAALAEEMKVEMMCLGCETGSTEQFELKWRNLIRQIRPIYRGLLTYNVNHSPLDRILWWDDLDFISISGYFYLEGIVNDAGRKTEQGNKLYQIPLEDMKAGLEIVRKELSEYSKKWNRPILFIECGVCNGKGCAREPWTHPNPSLVYDQEEQARFYTALFETFYNEPWFTGFAWWSWSGLLYDEEGAKTDISFNIHGKAAEKVVKEWYSKPRTSAGGGQSNAIKPSDPRATVQTVALLKSLKALSGKGILFGHHETLAAGVDWKANEFDSDIYRTCGKFPAVFGWDLGNIGQDWNIDGTSFSRMKTWIRQVYEKNGVNTLSWHMHNPATGGSSWDSTPVAGRLVPGGDLHDTYKKELDKAADFLNDLKGPKGEYIPVVCRFFHEQNGGWFWWGAKHCSADEYKKLWRFTVDYLRNEKNIHHVLYCISPDAFRSREEYLKTYPGDEYIDILGLDDYQGLKSVENRDWSVQMMEIVVSLADEKNKIAAITEAGINRMPDADWWTTVPLANFKTNAVTQKIAWFMVWKNYEPDKYFATHPGCHSAKNFKQFEADPFTLFLSEYPNLYAGQ